MGGDGAERGPTTPLFSSATNRAPGCVRGRSLNDRPFSRHRCEFADIVTGEAGGSLEQTAEVETRFEEGVWPGGLNQPACGEFIADHLDEWKADLEAERSSQ